VKSPNGEESQEERIHVDQEAVEDIGSEDGGKMKSKASADHHEEDTGDDGVRDGVEEADHHDDGANTEHGPGEHGREVSAFVDDDGDHVLKILSEVILSSSGSGTVRAELILLSRRMCLLMSRSRWRRRRYLLMLMSRSGWRSRRRCLLMLMSRS